MTKNRRVNTEWVEVGAGILLFAHLAARLLGDGYLAYARSPWLPLAVFGISTSFVMRSLLRWRAAYAAGAAVILAAMAASAAELFSRGAADAGLLFAAYALGYAACHVLRPRRWTDADDGPVLASDGELSLPGAVGGAFLVGIGAVGILSPTSVPSAVFGTFLLWPSAAASAAVVVGLAAVAAALGGRRGSGRLQLVVGAWMLAYAYGQVAARQDLHALATAAVGASLVLDRLVRRPHVRPPGLASAGDEQKRIYAYEEAGNASIWIIVAWSGVYLQFFERIDPTAYLAAVGLAIAIVVGYYHFVPIVAYGVRAYYWSLLGLIVAFSAYLAATGGLFSPFALFYAVIVLATAALPPKRAVTCLAAVQAYFAFELVRAVSYDQDPRRALAQFIFLSAGLVTSSLYAVILIRRQQRDEADLRRVNDELAGALAQAMRERRDAQEKAAELQAQSDDLLEMRSALMNLLEDVEESKKVIELERRREMAIFNALGEGVVATEREGRVFFCNPAAARILGLRHDEVVGQPLEAVFRLFREDSDVLETGPVTEAFAGKSSRLPAKLVLVLRDGRRVPVAGSVAPYSDERGEVGGVVVAFQDVTAEREIDRQKSDFISISSHQLRTPLSAIRWFIELLLAGDAGRLAPKQKDLLEDMLASAVRMSKLVNDLLNVSRIESGKLKLEPERTDLRMLIKDVIKASLPFMRAKRLRLEVDLPAGLPPARIDPGMTRQALENVVGNAVKYTLEGGTVAVKARADGPEIIVEVADSGLGIPRHQAHRVFDKFFRGDNVMAHETVGTGLGLYLAKTIMDLSGGRIWFESEEGKGTRFFLAFPTESGKSEGGENAKKRERP